ncbi:hypothetical protein Droror1_Dr00025787 [Drosera rotundifolia]
MPPCGGDSTFESLENGEDKLVAQDGRGEGDANHGTSHQKLESEHAVENWFRTTDADPQKRDKTEKGKVAAKSVSVSTVKKKVETSSDSDSDESDEEQMEVNKKKTDGVAKVSKEDESDVSSEGVASGVSNRDVFVSNDAVTDNGDTVMADSGDTVMADNGHTAMADNVDTSVTVHGDMTADDNGDFSMVDNDDTVLVVQHDFPQQSVCSKRKEAKFSQQDLLEHQTSVSPHQLQEDGQSPRQLDECGQSPKQLKRKGSPEQQKEGLSPQLDMDSSPQYKGSSPQQQQQEGVSSRNQLHEDERSVWQLEDSRSPQQLQEAWVPTRAAWPIATFVNDRVIINLVAARSAKKKAKELKRDMHRSSIWWLSSTDDSSERGHGEVLKQEARDFSIVWPPMVIIMNSRLDKEENKKRVGIGNEEPHDHFDSYHPVKARNSYDPVGNLDISILVFESSVAGHLDVERLHNQKQVGLLKDDEQFDLLELQEYGTDYYDDGLRSLFGEEVDESRSSSSVLRCWLNQTMLSASPRRRLKLNWIV